MIKESIKKVVDGKNLTREEAALTMDQIMRGDASSAQIAGLLTALRIKGETAEEITGFAEKMREHAVHIYPKKDPLVDTCGTGGDASNTFNISTVSALVCAGAGISIAKHGNRSVSSRCGSADLLEALGAKIDIHPKKTEEAINTIGFGFLFAPIFHPAMKFAAPIRKEIGIRTAFNILGPLTNPANAHCQVLGVFSAKLVELTAKVLCLLGIKNAFVVFGHDSLDEISTTGETIVSQITNGKISNYTLNVENLGIKKTAKENLISGSIGENKTIAEEILKGGLKGEKRDIVLVNSAAAIVAAEKAKSLQEALPIAEESIDSGAAWNKLQEYIRFSNKS
jgi:anthranilate phosphoribosyltransferase